MEKDKRDSLFSLGDFGMKSIQSQAQSDAAEAPTMPSNLHQPTPVHSRRVMSAFDKRFVEDIVGRAVRTRQEADLLSRRDASMGSARSRASSRGFRAPSLGHKSVRVSNVKREPIPTFD
eukprot:c7727_g1_i1.p1 GENE.c7727_g1_i1~~c7727_g1_i1.p1  ORF type:complete len:119 (+),score=9.43 c7727_g1_i1:43-399(+)